MSLPFFMATITKRGVYHNIHDSHWRYTVGNIRFVFSSEFYLRKFQELYMEEIERTNRGVNKLYNHKYRIEADELALLRMYLNTEKRGFLVIINGEEITCQDDLVFEGTLTYKPKFEELIETYKTNKPE